VVRRKNEDVSISFHFIERFKKNDTDESVPHPFSQDEFAELAGKLEVATSTNLDDEKTKDRVRYRHIALIMQVERPNKRQICGRYQASYWGHSYENSEVGKIPADSINLRPFFFLLYLSETGRIYIASQYLGPFGGYTALKNTILFHLEDNDGIVARSFNLGIPNFSDLKPREIEVNPSRRGKSITKKNVFDRQTVLIFKKMGKDDEFESQVKRQILDKYHMPKSELQAEIFSMLRESQLLDAEDVEIEDCKIVALKNGKTKTFHLFEESSFATKFRVDVAIDKDGHPYYEGVKAAALNLLEEEIISRKEDAPNN
jgi:hypothetical protein